ncbi:MAG: nucleotide sugar dehydrogenase [Cyanobacteriota bacterium]|nr:nucleotide sugar dehydrogenase [Cyanobacteriota bacterium]
MGQFNSEARLNSEHEINKAATMTPSETNVFVVGGLGHIGLPLGIMFANAGFPVTLLDSNRKNFETVLAGKLPFVEYGAEELLGEVLAKGLLRVSDSYAELANAKVVVVCIGTPVDEYMSPILAPFLKCIEDISNTISPETLVVIRSSVYPGSFQRIADILASKGITNVSYCPERIVQGYAVQEIKNLPQIVSGVSETAMDLSAQLFQHLTDKIIRSTVQEAELAKLFSNAWRYIQFAASNQFSMIADSYGCDFNRVHQVMTDGYERNRFLPRSGFAAGPCLLKDTIQLFSFYGNQFFLGQAAMNINEGYPAFIVERLFRDQQLQGKVVGILGMAFKADVDDTRDSLSFRLKKILEFRGAKVLCSDEYCHNPGWTSVQEVIDQADTIIVAVPHKAYAALDFGNKHVFHVFSA